MSEYYHYTIIKYKLILNFFFRNASTIRKEMTAMFVWMDIMEIQLLARRKIVNLALVHYQIQKIILALIVSLKVRRMALWMIMFVPLARKDSREITANCNFFFIWLMRKSKWILTDFYLFSTIYGYFRFFSGSFWYFFLILTVF